MDKKYVAKLVVKSEYSPDTDQTIVYCHDGSQYIIDGKHHIPDISGKDIKISYEEFPIK